MKGKLYLLVVGFLILGSSFSCAASPPACDQARIERKVFTLEAIEIHDAVCIAELMAAVEVSVPVPASSIAVYGNLFTWHQVVSYYTKAPNTHKCDQHDYGSCSKSRSAIIFKRPSFQFYLSSLEPIPWQSNETDGVKPHKKTLRRS